MPVAEIVSIGTELLLGELTDTNAGRIARAMRDIGVDIYRLSTVGDNKERITRTLREALDRSDVVISSGGLGPTIDDMTREAVAQAVGRDLVYSKELELQIARRFERIGRPMGENNKRQAWIPLGAVVLENPVGTAPCFAAQDTRTGSLVISLPGVPHELEYMLPNRVIPLIKKRFEINQITRVRVLRTCGMGESNIDRALDDLLKMDNPSVGLAAHTGQTDVRITVKAENIEKAEKMLDSTEEQIRDRLKENIYGIDKQTLAEVTGELLARNGFLLSVTDTICGGKPAAEITRAGFGGLIQNSVIYETPDDFIETLPSNLRKLVDMNMIDNFVDAAADHQRMDNTANILIFGPMKDNSIRIAVSIPHSIPQIYRSSLIEDNQRGRNWISLQAINHLRLMLPGIKDADY